MRSKEYGVGDRSPGSRFSFFLAILAGPSHYPTRVFSGIRMAVDSERLDLSRGSCGPALGVTESPAMELLQILIL